MPLTFPFAKKNAKKKKRVKDEKEKKPFRLLRRKAEETEVAPAVEAGLPAAEGEETPRARKRRRAEPHPLPHTQKEREEREADRVLRAEARRDPNSKLNIAMPYIWIAAALLLGLCVYTPGGGALGGVLRFLFLSLFSYAAYILPVVFFLAGIGWRRAVAERTLKRRTVLFSFALVLVLSLVYILTLDAGVIGGEIPKEEVTLEAGTYFSLAEPRAVRGGFIGALFGWILYRLVGPVMTIVLAALAVLLYGIFGFGFSPDVIVRSAIRAAKEKKESKRRRKAEARAEAAARTAAERMARAERLYLDRNAEDTGDGAPETAPETEETPADPPLCEEEVRHRRFADIFAETGGSTATETSETTEPPHSGEGDLRAFKEQKIRERLRSHDGIHTYVVSDLCPSTITEPRESAPVVASAPSAAAPAVTDGASAESTAAIETEAAPEVEETAPFRGVEDFRRITVTEPVRVYTAPAAPAAPTPERHTETAPAAVPTSLLRESSPAMGEERGIIREHGAAVERSGTEEVPTSRRKAEPKRPSYRLPPTSLLRVAEITEGSNDAEIQKNADILVKTLESFGIPITITGFTRGPRITRYEFVQKAGIRVDKVASYANDITQKLSTQGVRIEAPIPNKSSIGVEVPNQKSPPVRIRSLLDTDAFRDAPSKTTVAVGCDVGGSPVFFDIAKAPHMLIAGATGMGKSVCINSILISLLYKATPDDVRLILIDPKKVEFNVYSKVPHLLIPVVTDPTKAAGALNWAVNEMEKRYDMIEEAGVRDIKSYNAYCEKEGMPTLPKIVIIIDELNDLMMSARKMVEASICRIAQKARAAGIHLLIGTQRPSVNVITGDIKVNIPARIAFRVNQQVDSRTILDMQGAEKLLPHGDMLFSPAGTPQRVQGAFVEDEEVKTVVSFLAENVGEAVFDDAILADIEKEAAKCAQKNGDDGGDDDEGGGGNLDGVLDDPKFEQALDIAFSTGSISTSLLQRRIGVGFGRASRFIDAMCEMGIVGEARGGAKPRELLLSRAEYEERKRRIFDE